MQYNKTYDILGVNVAVTDMDKKDIQKVKAENKVILLEILFFLDIVFCFYAKSNKWTIGTEWVVILGMLVLSVSLCKVRGGYWRTAILVESYFSDLVEGWNFFYCNK